MGLAVVFRGLKTASSSVLRHSLSSTAAASKYSPLLMLPSVEVADNYTTDAEISHMDYSFYRLSDKQTFSLHNRTKSQNPIPDDAFCYGSSSDGWLLYGDPRDCSLLLTNPLSPSPPTISLPPITTLSSIQVVRGRRPENRHGGEPDSPPVLLAHNKDGVQLEVMPPLTMHRQLIHRFAMSCSPDSDSAGDCVLMAIQNSPKELAICKPGANSEAWLNVGIKPARPIIEVAYSPKDGLFYTLNLNNEVETWRVDHVDSINWVKRNVYNPVFKHPKFDHFEEWVRDGCVDAEYLVESSGEILFVLQYRTDVVDRDGLIVYDRSISAAKQDIKLNEYDPNKPSRTVRFDVYKLTEAKSRWIRLKSIGDRVLFLGMNERFSVSASDFPELKPNSIYFTDEGPCVAMDWGIYSLQDQTVTAHYPCRPWSKIRPPPCWIYSPHAPPN